jgi:hypothetical protein
MRNPLTRKWSRKPPPGTPINLSHPLVARSPQVNVAGGGGLVLACAFLEGTGGQCHDSGPLKMRSYQMDPANGMTASTLGFTACVATIYPPTWTGGPQGTVAYFQSAKTTAGTVTITQANEALFQAPYIPWPDNRGPATVMSRFLNLQATGNQAVQFYQCGNQDDTTSNGFAMYCGDTGDGVGTLTLGNGAAEVAAGGGTNGGFYPTVGNWHTAGCAYSGFSANHVCNFFMDGKMKRVTGTAGSSGSTQTSLYHTVGAIWINAGESGNGMDGNGSSAGGWDGYLDYVYVWNRLLSNEEMVSVWQNPYQIFEAPSSRVWFVSPAAAATIVDEDGMTFSYVSTW